MNQLANLFKGILPPKKRLHIHVEGLVNYGAKVIRKECDIEEHNLTGN